MKSKKDKEKIAMDTACIWAGEKKSYLERCAQIPVVHSVSYEYDDLDEWYNVAIGQEEGHIYSRNTNPTVKAFEEKILELDGAEAATSFSTGMGAISNALFTLLSPGDRVVSIKDTYGGTNKMFIEFLPRLNVDVCLCETSDFDQIETEVLKGCRVLYLESPTNPTLKVIDIQRLAKAAHKVGAIVIVDNTVATPVNQKPLALGADLVVYSATKFLGGHSDAMGGVVTGSKDLVEKIYHYREITGATLHPMAAYLLLRGMKTLSLRIRQHNHNAQKVAELLSQHHKIDQVFYPGLKNHLHHEVAQSQMLEGFGGMLSFSLKGDFSALKTFLPALQFVHRAAHLGGVETIAAPPRTSSHVELTPEERKAAGIPENLVRLSVGIEDVNDILADLEHALDKV